MVSMEFPIPTLARLIVPGPLSNAKENVLAMTIVSCAVLY